MRRTLLLLTSLLIAGLALAACGDDRAGDTTSTTSDDNSTTSTTSTSVPDTVTTTLAGPGPTGDCDTAFGRVAWIEATGEPTCMNVGAHQQLVVQNATAEAIELTWADATQTVAPGDLFESVGSIGDRLTPGTYRLDSADVDVTLSVLDPDSSLFVQEPMLLRRWGPVRVGDTVADAENRLGAELVFPDEESFPDGACLYGWVEGDPYSPGFMVHDREKIVRMDASAPWHRTASGIQIGSTAEEVIATYGEDRIERTPHAYVDGEYLTLVPRDEIDQAYRVVFETIRDEFPFVTAFRNGLEGPVSWIEGCL